MPDHSSTPIFGSQSSETVSSTESEYKTTSWPSSTDTEGWTDKPVTNNTIYMSSTIDVCSTIEVDREEKKEK